MPFTPYHFGPGLLLKAVFPRSFSLATFIAVQIVIDLETLYHLVRREWPVHRALHSLLGGTAVGVAVGVAAWLLGSILVRRAASPGSAALPMLQAVRTEASWIGTLVGGVVGGTSHVILDGIMHRDVRPYWPFSPSPGWQGIVSVGTLHSACLLSGALGAFILWFVSMRRSVSR